MEYLDALQYILDCLDIIKAGKRDLITKDKLDDVAIYVGNVDKILSRKSRNSAFHFVMEKTIGAIATIKDLKIDNIPNDMKQVLVDSLYQMRVIVANLAYDYFTINDFDETVEEDVELLLEVIRIRRGIKDV